MGAGSEGEADPARSGRYGAKAEVREYRTRSGKAVIIRETHPRGQSLSTLEVTSKGFEHELSEAFEDSDPVADVLVADLDGNGFDEIYVITRSAGSGSYGDVLAFASNRDRT